MIPRTVADLEAMAAESVRQRREVVELMEAHGEDVWAARPGDGGWSATQHLAHLVTVNERYLGRLEEVVAEARSAGGPSADGPYRHPWFARWFVRYLDAPPKRRLKTLKAMIPGEDPSRDEMGRAFGAGQDRLGEAIRGSEGLDLGRVRFSSPYSVFVRLSLGTGLELLLSHNRRHIWHMRRLLGSS